MSKWNEILDRHYAVAYDRNEFVAIKNSPATIQQIESLEGDLDFQFPEEWRNLYLTTDGFGVKPIGSDEFRFDLFPSLSSLAEFIDGVRKVIADTHPGIAAAFVPIMDLGGDAVGYSRADSTTGLYRFDHELFRYNEQQDCEEFLFSISAASIENLLLP